jgi:hypothetical protein
VEVAAIIVTKGDQDLTPVLASLPEEWDVLVWSNGAGNLVNYRTVTSVRVQDLSVYGRYAAIEYTDADLIYVQDDDCIVSNPHVLVHNWLIGERETGRDDHVVCNMPPEFRHDFYTDHALVGFGAVFHRDAPQRAFDRLNKSGIWMAPDDTLFESTCDIVFTALTPRVLVNVPVENMTWAYHYDRMYRQPEHQAERVRMLDLVRQLA